MLANADIDFDDDNSDEAHAQSNMYNDIAGNNNHVLGSHGANYNNYDSHISGGGQGNKSYPKLDDDDVDDEDRYLDDIINRNYQKAPPAVV